MVLFRIDSLDIQQPEEQHGFRAGRRIGEHFLTANLIMDKTFQCNIPPRMANADLSKTFDRVSWPVLWTVLRRQGVSDQLILALGTSRIVSRSSDSSAFDIKACVRWAIGKAVFLALGCCVPFCIHDDIPQPTWLRNTQRSPKNQNRDGAGKLVM